MRSRTVRGTVGALLASIVLGGITACGSGVGSSANVGPNNGSNGAGASGASNQTLYVGLTAYPITMDPLTSSAWFDRQIMFNVYDTLFQLGDNNQIEPDLVSSYEISADGLTYTLHLKQGVQFQDGTPFNAAAVKWNLERYQGKTSTSRSALTDITSIDTPDDNTVVLHLSAPFSPLLSIFTDRAGMMVSPTAAQKEGANYASHPVGTGPYEYKDSVQGDHITLVENPKYWNGEPHIPTVVFRAFTDPNVELQNLESGSVQIIDSVPPQQVSSLQQNPKFTTISKPSWGWAGYALNTGTGALANQYLREAVNEAIDRTQLVTVVAKGQATPGYSAISPSQPGYDQQEDTPPTPDAATIKSLLAKGGKPNGFTFTLKTLASDSLTAQTIQGMLSQYGIQMNIQQMDAASLGAAQNNGNFDAILAGWSGRLDPDQNMSQYFYSNGPLNWVHFKNAQVDTLLNQARSQQSITDRQKTYAQVTDILHQQVPIVFLYHKNNILGMAANLKSFPYRPDGMIRVASLYFAN